MNHRSRHARRLAGAAVFALGLFALPRTSHADHIAIDVTVPAVKLAKDARGYTQVQIPGYLSLARPGSPALPSRAIYALLPAGHAAASVTVTAQQVDSLAGHHTVVPAQRPWPLSLPSAWTESVPDPTAYARSNTDATHSVRAGSEQKLLGADLLPLEIRPVLYDADTGRLDVVRRLRIEIETEPAPPRADSALARFRGRPSDLRRLRGLVVNPERLPAQSPALLGAEGETYEYIVITSAALAACTGDENLAALVAEKESRGISTKIVTVEQIESDYDGLDAPDKIRNFIRDMVENHGTEYVLLAGDADAAKVGYETEAPVVPIRYLEASEGMPSDEEVYPMETIPSDLYYACLDGTFDGDGDGIYGEGTDSLDYLADVRVGRAPVDSCAEVELFVRKNLAYRQAGGSYLRRVYMVGEYLFDDPELWGKDFLEPVRNGIPELDTVGVASSDFFETKTLYDRDLGAPDSWGPDDILEILNSDTHVINHLGHSFTYYNMRLMTDEMIEGLHNDNLFFSYSEGCYAGAFDNSDIDYIQEQDSFAEHLVLGEHGAVAAVMNTRYGLGGVSDLFHATFWDGMFQQDMTRLGDLHTYSRDRLSDWVAEDYDGTMGMRYTFYAATLFGDPELSLHTTLGPYIDTPDPISVESSRDEGPVQIQLSFANAREGEMIWQAAAAADWLDVSPAQGTAEDGDRVTLTLTLSPEGLSPGVRETELLVDATRAENHPQVPIVWTLRLRSSDIPGVELPIALDPELGGSGGCATTGADGANGSALLLFFVGLLAVRRRRKQAAGRP